MAYMIFPGAAKLLDQITENEQERLFELERKDQENIQMQRYVEKMMEEDQVSLEKKAAEQAALRVCLWIFLYLVTELLSRINSVPEPWLLSRVPLMSFNQLPLKSKTSNIQKIAVIILKFEQYVFTVNNVSKRCRSMEC